MSSEELNSTFPRLEYEEIAKARLNPGCPVNFSVKKVLISSASQRRKPPTQIVALLPTGRREVGAVAEGPVDVEVAPEEEEET